VTDHHFAESIRRTKNFFDNTTLCFDEKDADFAPKPGMFTTAQQIAHAAQAMEWFVDGAFSPEGMTTDFEAMEAEVRKIVTLKEARAWMDHAQAHVLRIIEKKPMMELMLPIAGHVMAGMPRREIFEAIADHTAHHRGALAVYARLLGKAPRMPYA
jgi:uncharacterized damage-inducible protein DinB